MSDLPKAQAFLASLSEVERDLPCPPALLSRLFRLTGENSRASMDEIASSVEQSQGFTASVLAMANSAFYGLQARISTVSRALTVLGLKEVRTMVLTLMAASLVKSKSLPESFDASAHWGHQLRVALLARYLGMRLKTKDAEILFTAGLLHDFGKLLTALYRPEDYLAIQALREERGVSAYDAENGYWGIDHGVVGAVTLALWNLPEELTEPVNWHHSPEGCTSQPDEARILCLCDSLDHARQLDLPLPAHCLPLLEHFGLHADALLEELDSILSPERLEAFLAFVTDQAA